jgi:hypothetical protein
MSNATDPYLTNVQRELRTKQRQLDDAEWNDDPYIEQLAAEVQRLRELDAQGVIYDPKF